MADSLTVLTHKRALATKRITPAGIQPYGNGKHFAVQTLPIGDVSDLASALRVLADARRSFVIRGALREGLEAKRVRRLCNSRIEAGVGVEAPFKAKARRWLALDLDSLPAPEGIDAADVHASARFAMLTLPRELARASCVVQLTSGAGLKPGIRCRIWYWLDRPVSDREAKQWLRGCPVDLSLYDPVHPHYTAAPLFVGVTDPVPERSRLITGDIDMVAAPRLDPARVSLRRSPSSAASLPSKVAPARGGSRAERYMLACVRAVSNAPRGQGRETCMRVAVRLYGMAHAGLLDRRDVTARLKGAMRARGWNADEDTRGDTLADVSRQLQWAWEHAGPQVLDR